MPTKKNYNGEQQNYDPNTGEYTNQALLNGDVKKWKESKIDYISNHAKVNKNIASRYLDTIENFTGNMSKQINNPQTVYEKQQRTIIDDFMNRMPKHNGTIYRGFSTDNIEDIKGFIKKGNIVSMKDIESWSKNKDTGIGFAEQDDRKFRVLLKTNTTNGVDIENVSNLTAEREILEPRKHYKVKDINLAHIDGISRYTINLEEYDE